MPWAAHGVVDHQSLVKRSAQMAAGVANSEDVVAEPREQRLCTADMASLHPAIGYVSHSNTSGKIGSEVGRVAEGFLLSAAFYGQTSEGAGVPFAQSATADAR